MLRGLGCCSWRRAAVCVATVAAALANVVGRTPLPLSGVVGGEHCETDHLAGRTLSLFDVVGRCALQ
jgi:hypothetical protein